MFRLDFKRILRTALQALCGAIAASFETLIAAQFSTEVIIATLIQLGVTIAAAVLMNISSQLEIQELDEEKPKGWLDWKRILRTLIQAACGATAVLIESIAFNFNKDVIIAAVIQFGITVASAVLMNIQKQLQD